MGSEMMEVQEEIPFPISLAFLLDFHSRLIAAAPQGRSAAAAGVFLVIEGGRYTFNYTVAKATCQGLNVTMATRPQMERALHEGLQTCKFGWIAEQIAVVPRITFDEKCGKGQTGVVEWKASPGTQFAVFCYNASANEELNETNTTPPSAPSTTPIPRTPTPSPVTPSVRSTHAPSSTNKPTKFPEQKMLTFTITRPVRTTHPTRTPHITPPTRHGVTTKPAAISLTFSTSAHSPEVLSSSEPVLTRSVIITTEKSLGVGPTALIILGVIALLLMGSIAVWYYKLNIVPCGSQSLQKDGTETEMWKHADSEIDLHNQRGPEDEEEEESERKYSSEITLCVNPSIKANSSE